MKPNRIVALVLGCLLLLATASISAAQDSPPRIGPFALDVRGPARGLDLAYVRGERRNRKRQNPQAHDRTHDPSQSFATGQSYNAGLRDGAK